MKMADVTIKVKMEPIVQCNYCKYANYDFNGELKKCDKFPTLINPNSPRNFYCGFAEKITNSDKISDKKMIEYAKAIQDYCKQHGTDCGNCIFSGYFESRNICQFGTFPGDWQLSEANKND